MLYLMTVLTFLAAMMFYMLSPRDDKIHLDTYQAEPLIQDLITQHQAAKDYFSQWFGAYLSAATGNYFNLVADNTGYSFEGFFPKAIKEYSMCDENRGAHPGFNDCFLSRVICTDADGKNPDGSSCSSLVSGKQFIVTYGGWSGTQSNPQRPSWWPKDTESRARRNERWRRAIAQRTHGSLNCGTLYQDPNDPYPDDSERWQWCLDNGQVTQEKRLGGAETRCAKPIPVGVITGLNVPGADVEAKKVYLFDMFFCMSPLVQGPAHYYPSGLTHYFDGLDNQNQHAPVSNVSTHKIGQQSWTDLISGNEYAGADMSFSAKSGLFPDAPTPYATLSGSLYFDIAPENSDFSVSEVIALTSATSLVQLMTFEKPDTSNPYPRVSVDYIGAEGLTDRKIVLTVQQADNTWYKFNAEVHLQANQPFTLTLVRTGDEIDLYMGGHETLSQNERKLFSGHLSSEERTEGITEIKSTQDTVNTAFGYKMYIKNSDNNNPLRVYAVRSFGRGLNTTDVYKIYKEDVKRYGASYATQYGTVFEGDIDWPRDEYGQYKSQIDRIN